MTLIDSKWNEKKNPFSLPVKESSVYSRLYEKAWEEYIPLTATIEVTVGCNLKCVHCYNYDRSKPAPKTLKDNVLNPTQIYKLIDDLKEAGTLYLAFTGGEVLTHPHIVDFVRYAKKQGFWIRLKSNATLLTEEKAKILADAGAKDIEISLYGATAKTHDSFTMIPGSFEKTWNGILIAKKYNITPSISYVLHKNSVHELGEMIESAKVNGVTANFSTELTERYDGSDGSTLHRVTKEQFEELLRGPYSELFSDDNPDGELQCACARTTCGISSTGEVYPCIGAPLKSGSLHEKNFLEVWRTSPEFFKIRNLKKSDFKSCDPCQYKKSCQRSSGGVYSSTGNYTGPETQTCQEAKSRHEFLNLTQ